MKSHGDGLEQPVAHRMPQRVVDVLEAVEVEEQHGDLLQVPLGQAQRLRDPVVQQHPVRQARQEVVLGRVQDLLSHGAGLCHVAKNDHGAVDLAFAVANGGDGSLHRRLEPVTPDQDVVRRRLHRFGLGPGDEQRARRVRTRRGIQNSDDLRQGPAGGLVLGPPHHLLRHEVQEGDVARLVRRDDAVADTVERDGRALSLDEEHLFHRLALDGVAQRSEQPARFDLTLDQVVLRAFLQGSRGQPLIVPSGQDHQGHPWGHRMGAAYPV